MFALLWLVAAVACVLLFLQYQRIQKELSVKNHEIEQLKRRGSEFVANVSHELKTPLTSIQGYTETLKSGAIADPVKAKEFLDRIDDNAKRLSRLINDILDLSRIESPNLYLEKETILLPDFFDEIKGHYILKLSERKQTLVVTVPPLELKADRRIVEQAIHNLIDNAHRYCPEGSLIELSAQRHYEDGVEQIMISVADNGPGISAEDLPRLFERFYRADKSRNRLLGGTGLGLAIVKHIMLSHGGSVRVASSREAGTRFDLLFPILS